MIKSYLVSALRNLNNHRVYSLVNILGLVAGLSCSMVIIIYINYEFSYDRFHANAARIYRLVRETRTPQGNLREPLTSAPLAAALAREFAEVEGVARFRSSGQTAVRHGGVKFYETSIDFADSSVFTLFTYPMLRGDPRTALAKPFSVVITQQIARKYFGSDDAIDSVLRFNNQDDYTVTGVIADLPENTDHAFSMLCSLETLRARKDESLDDRWSFGYVTYVLLRKDADAALIEQRFPPFILKVFGSDPRREGKEIALYLHPLTKVHLYSHLEGYPPGRISQVYSFGALALFLILIACVNFMNLSTARSATRAKEVGIRKVVGADRRALIAQFLGESVFLSMIALVFAFFLMELMLPLFSAVIGQRLQFSYTGNPILLLSFILLALVVGVISGSYPAFFLSRFQIVEVLRTRNPGLGARRVRLRSALVVLQFFISTLFIAQTLILRNQIRYLTGKDIGFDKRNVVVIPLADESTRSGLNTIETRLRGIPGVAGVGAASILPGWYIPRGFKIPEGSGEDRMQLMDEITVDPGFIPTMGIAMLAGRNFLDHSPRDEQGGIIINETAARRFGWEDPIGRTIRSRNGAGASTTMRVCGVVKDFHLASLYRLIEPLCITDDPRQLRHLLVRIAPGTETESVGKIRAMWNQVFPDQPFDYSFLDQTYDHFFRVLERVLRVLLGFALLAVLIACLGIFALAAYTTERQTKAIGIRKVMGASALSIMLGLNKETMKLVAIAIGAAWIALKIPFVDPHKYFPYLAEVSPITTLLAMVTVAVVAILTVSYHSLRAALTDPVRVLRYE